MSPASRSLTTSYDDDRQRLAERLRLLTAVTGELLGARSVAEVVETVTHRMTDAAGAVVGTMSLLLDEETLALVGIRGASSAVASRWATYPLSGRTPGSESLRERRPVVVAGRAALRERYPEVELATEREQTIVCLPLVAGGEPLGVVSLSFPGVRDVDDAELGFYELLADICAHSVGRIRATEEATDREAKLDFLARVTDRLISDLDYESTLRAVAEMAVPWFADWCSIQLVQDGRLRPIAVAHRQPHHADLVEELQRRFPPSPDAPRGAYRVLRTGQSDLIPDLTDEVLAMAAQSEEHLELLRRLEFRSAMACPLVGHDRVLGVVTWVAGEGGRRYDQGDVAFGEDLARRAAVAIDNADLHSQVRDVALRLQRAVLPDRLPETPAYRTAVTYTPAGRTLVGGDFYDVVQLPDGRVVAFVGDVMGRGVEAAAVMAQMRATIRTLVALDPTPDVVLARLDDVVTQLGLEHLVTLVYAVACGAGASGPCLEVASAGHPAPLLLRGDGSSEVADLPQGLVLGVEAHPARPAAVRIDLRPGDRLLMFSDGLVERREEDYDDGLARLVRACEEADEPDLQAWLDRVVAAVHDSSRDDDVAALLLEAAD